jgi:hypothetical protein
MRGVALERGMTQVLNPAPAIGIVKHRSRSRAA